MSRRTLVVLMLALLGVECAGSAGERAQPPPAIVADMSLSGTTVQMTTGQRLIVSLEKAFQVTKGQRPSVRYPAGLMSFSAQRSVSGDYVFRARRPGRAQISIFAPGCSPGPMAGVGIECPVAGPAKVSSTRGNPSWLFALTIRITRAN
jgi:hypothetical protein